MRARLQQPPCFSPLTTPNQSMGTPSDLKELENPAMRELFMGVIPMRKAVDASEIAAAAVFLASDDAKSINGHTIRSEGVGEPGDARTLHGRHPHEEGGRCERDCSSRRVSRL